jgi:hypothetical protein
MWKLWETCWTIIIKDLKVMPLKMRPVTKADYFVKNEAFGLSFEDKRWAV